MPWERRDHEHIACYYLNCLSEEQLKSIPVTSQLNFTTVLAGDIFATEAAELIHVHEGARGYDLALVGLAIANAMRIPLVYHKLNAEETSNSVSAGTESLSQARARKDHQCMVEADAIIVASEEQRIGLVNSGVAADKVFVWPVEDRPTAVEDAGILQGKITAMCRQAYAYAQSACRKKYGY